MRRRRFRKKSRKSADTWQIIYMDLMTMIMVFFVILWSLNQGKDDGISETVGDVTTRLIDLPGDVLFGSGKTELTGEGRSVLRKLFSPEKGKVVSFETNDLVKRMLVIHGHTDSEGTKSRNLGYGFNRALSAYEEIRKHSPELQDHVVICTHADNSPVENVPDFKGQLSTAQRQAASNARRQNRRITIEDKLVNQFEVEP